MDFGSASTSNKGRKDFGKDYTCSVLKLLILRCVRQNVFDFWVDRSSFDDNTLHLRKTDGAGSSLIQIKYQPQPKNITSEELLADAGDFSLNKYLTALAKLKGNAVDWTIVTNRGVNRCKFLARDCSKSSVNICTSSCRYKVDLKSFYEVYRKGKQASFDPDQANVYLVEQKPFDLHAQIEMEIEELVKQCKLILADVKAISGKLDWGLHGCHHLGKQHVVAELCEQLLHTYKVDTTGDDFCAGRDLWNKIVGDKIVTLVDFDEAVLKFLKGNRDGPLVLQVNSAKDYGVIKSVSERFNNDFRVVVISTIGINLPLGLDVTCFASLCDLNKADRAQVLDQEVSLQGRSSVKLRTLVDKSMYKYVRCRDVIRILLRNYSVGYGYEPVPDYFINRGLCMLELAGNNRLIFHGELESLYGESGIISANPGSGKSTYLRFMANQAPANVWVLKIDLRHQEHYEKLISTTQALDLLKYINGALMRKHKCTNAQLADAVFQRMAKAKRVLVLMDGFDEVPAPHQDAIICMARCLYKEGYRLWMTTCPDEQAALEENLDTIATTIRPLTIEEQKHFLTKYIMQMPRGDDANIGGLVDRCLEATHCFDDGGDLGTLLLLKLLVDVVGTKAGAPFDKVLNLHHLWEAFHRNRIDTLCGRYSNYAEDLREFFDKHYKALALSMVFHRYDLSGLAIYEEFEYCLKNINLMQILRKEGVIEAQGANFAHHTYAQYLAALWLSENLSTKRARCLIKKRFQNVSHYRFLFKIFDYLLARNCPLHRLIIGGHVGEAQKIVQARPYCADGVDGAGRTVLHVVALYGHALEPIPYVASEDRLGYSALDYAIGSGSLAVANKICEKLPNIGINIDIEPSLLRGYLEACSGYDWLLKALFKYLVCLKLLTKEIEQSEPLELCYELDFEGRFASYVSDLGAETVSDLLEKMGVKSDGSYYYDLRLAAAFGTEENITGLLSKGVEVNSMGNSSYSPLHCTIIHGQTANAELLITKGADVDAAGLNGNTALHVAIEHDEAASLTLLLSNAASVNKQNGDGDTPLHYALRHNKDYLVECLLPIPNHCYDNFTCRIHQLDHPGGSIDPDIQNKDGDTPILLALKHGKIKIAGILQHSYGADMDIENYEGCSCAHYAAQAGAARFVTCRRRSINGRDKDGNTPLLLALSTRHLSIARVLLGQGADANIENNDGYSCLHYAAKAGAYDVILWLISSGLDVNKRNKHGETPLLLAFRHLQFSTVRLLLARSSHDHIDDGGNTCLHYAASLGEVDAAAMLIDKGLDINRQNRDGDTPLLLALQRKHVATARLLLGNGADISIANSSGNSCLHYAVTTGDDDVVLRLVSGGLDVNKRNTNGETAAFLAFKYAQSSGPKLLLAKSSDDVGDGNGNSWLHYAAQQGEAAIVQELVDKGVDLNKQNSDGDTPLLLALKNRRSSCAKLLLRSGADARIENNSRSSCLHHAAGTGDDEIVLRLLNEGLDVNKQDGSGHTPLFLAIVNNHESTKRVLLANNADIGAVCNNDYSCVHYAARAGADDVLSLVNKGLDFNHQDKRGFTPLLEALDNKKINTAKLLLSYGADVNIVTEGHNTCLHYAAKAGADDIVRDLIKWRLDVNKQNTNRDTPLSLALEHGHITTAKLLRDHGASTDIKNRYGHSCLHLASEAGDAELVLELATKGLNLNQRNNSGETPLFHAVRRKRLRVTKLLLAHGADVHVAGWGEENTCLHYAAEAGFDNGVIELLSKGAQINAKNSREETPMRLALVNGHARTVELLFSRGALITDDFLCRVASSGDHKLLAKLPALSSTKLLLVDKELDYKRTMLHYSIRETCCSEADVQRQLKTVKLVLSNGADVNMQDLEGNTPLHYASKRVYSKNTSREHVQFTKHFYASVTKLLLDAGADVTLKNTCGNTALDLAINRENIEIISLIQQQIKKSGLQIHSGDEVSSATDLVLHSRPESEESRCALF